MWNVIKDSSKVVFSFSFFVGREEITLLSVYFLYKVFEGNINLILTFVSSLILDAENILVPKNQGSRSEKRYRGH